MALSPDIIQEYFDKASKCKIDWELINFYPQWENDWCMQSIQLILKNENWYYQAHSDFNNWECIVDSFHEQYFETQLQIWQKYSFILDDSYKILIKSWENKKIQTCTWNEIHYENNIFLNNYFIFWIWIFIILSIWIILFKKKKQL
jgi:ATP-dependent Zn protease